MFKKANVTPAAKQSEFTASQIISDITNVIKQEEDNNDFNNPFYVEHSEKWYNELKEFKNVTNKLIDTLDNGADRRDELQRLKADLEKGADSIKKKATEALECK